MVVSLVVADDHPIVLDGICAVLARRPSTRVVATAVSGEQAIEAARAHGPDLVVVDLSFPDVSGFEVVRQVRDSLPATHAIVVSAHGELPFAARAFAVGARGYVVKEDASAGILAAIDAVLQGGRFVSAPLTLAEVDRYREDAGAGRWRAYEQLTDRERQVFELTVTGLTAAETAARLGISPRTAEAHRAKILGKLGVANATELVHYAYRHGLVARA